MQKYAKRPINSLLLEGIGMSSSQESLELFLKDLPFLNGLRDSDIHDFIKSSHIKQYTKNQVIFLHADNADRFFIVLSGWVKLHRETPEGEEAIIGLLTRGDIFGEAAIFCEAKYPFSAHCAEEAQLIEIPASTLKEKAKENPDVMAWILNIMCHEAKHLQLENEHMTLMSTPQRVGCLLLQLSAGIVGKGGTFPFPYDKSLAATQLGMKPETFSRALVQLKPFGVVIKGSEVTIENFEHLIEYTCVHCSAELGECKKSGDCTSECTKNKECSA